MINLQKIFYFSNNNNIILFRCNSYMSINPFINSFNSVLCIILSNCDSKHFLIGKKIIF